MKPDPPAATAAADDYKTNDYRRGYDQGRRDQLEKAVAYIRKIAHVSSVERTWILLAVAEDLEILGGEE